ncbi:acylphosphatase [Pseudomonas lalucatii]|uniref:Acylphosphatase n=1 Tax=Pseudomonas lalucatii TaxID=1424203 RepID=A0ABS5Q3I0_9PSED|nr:acylphosphatase [Pseudomonas lalucatii]MBS7663326.1 acylphosphatase [Pseudomonas lalucatii]MBS7689894.1 acylphosphatase [Pseudomonas lalucatii]MBS7724964.1 acylphosphatase [Pseudomonas lalucatii]QVM87069.1 acylphosphatase [Pseudomonas lalucatii]
MAQICVHGYVSGRVQGVWFRQSTVEQAERLGLQGWVRNLEDGRVEVLAEGDEPAVRALTAWLEHGPSGAQVTAVDLQEQPLQGIAGFVLRR